MKSLPLRVKIAALSAIIAGLTMGLALVGMRYFLHFDLLADTDERIHAEAQLVISELDRISGGSTAFPSALTRSQLPRPGNIRFIEIYERDNRLLYRSERLQTTGRTLGGGPSEHHEFEFERIMFRVGTYYHKFLTIRVAVPMVSYASTMQRIDIALGFALPGVIILCACGGFLVAGRALRPVKEITATAQHINAENLHARLPVPATRDELFTLTEVLNEMFGRLAQSYGQAINFASNASHQLKTPVTVMRIGLEAMLKDPTLSPEQITELNDLVQQTRRLTSLAEGLLLLARADAGRLKVNAVETDLRMIIEGCIEDAEILAASKKLTIESEIPAGGIVAIADAERTEQVLLNLLENAVKYNHEGGRITVTADTDAEGPFIIVANTGEPIPGDKMAVIFGRFVRGESDEARAGHGLGLSIARELARAQGGELRLLRSDAEITEFELRLRAPGKEAIKREAAHA